MKNIIPVVMAGVLGIYGLIIAVIIGNAVKPFDAGGGTFSDYSAFTGFAHLSAGLCCGWAAPSRLLARRPITRSVPACVRAFTAVVPSWVAG